MKPALLLAVILPWTVKRQVYRRLCGWVIGEGARVGFSYVGAHHVELGAKARIGHMNVIRDLRVLTVGEASIIGQWNWITASLAIAAQDPSGASLRVGRHAAVTSRHYIDCTGGVRVGDFATIAGVRSVVMTHQIDATTNKQTSRPVEIGSYCLISSNVSLAPGASVPARSLVAMGAVVVGQLASEGYLYAGVPAVEKRPVSGTYFDRQVGEVLPKAADE